MLLACLPGLAGVAGCGLSSAADPGAGSASPARKVAVKPSGTGPADLRAALTRPTRPVYYLSLGDSLAKGVQPGPTGNNAPTARGYPDQLAERLRGVLPGLRLVKLGCSGETTTTMIHGGICGYSAGGQLAEATRFLRSHRGQVALVTIDIGGNDPNSCIVGAQYLTIPGCMSRRMKLTERNLTTILGRLRSAAGPRTLMVGMTYYVPELGLWKTGQGGKALAGLTADFVAGADKMLTKRYHRFGARVADVFDAFRSADFRQVSAVPVNVSAVCALTWMCASPPRGPNEHANDAGYRVIARSFWRAITR